jgi:hypothetical protein
MPACPVSSLDPFADEFLAAPYPFYAELRKAGPVVWLIAGTDCGLGGRVHPQIAWAKLEALSEGAKLATKELWS